MRLWFLGPAAARQHTALKTQTPSREWLGVALGGLTLRTALAISLLDLVHVPIAIAVDPNRLG
jgi:hypothetical protein